MANHFTEDVDLPAEAGPFSAAGGTGGEMSNVTRPPEKRGKAGPKVRRAATTLFCRVPVGSV